MPNDQPVSGPDSPSPEDEHWGETETLIKLSTLTYMLDSGKVFALLKPSQAKPVLRSERIIFWNSNDS